MDETGDETVAKAEFNAPTGIGSDLGSADLFAPPQISIEATVAPKVSFATHQSAIPVLRDLRVENQTSATIENLVLEVTADPAILAPRRWQIDRIAAGGFASIRDRDVELNAAFLLGLSEAVSGSLKLRLETRDGDTLAERDFPIEVMAPNEWGGGAVMPELLAVFIQPNDPAVGKLLKAASGVLQRAGRPEGLDGYTSKSRTRSYELASAIWSAMAGLRLTYAVPPASFETAGQKIRTPSQILEGGLATCLDTATFFVAALEQAGLNPVLVLTKGHAFVGMWLQPQQFSNLITDDASAVRKRIALKELIVFETTLATSNPVPGFSVALASAERQIDIDHEADFVMALDIRRARMQRLRPLAFAPAPSSGTPESEADPVAEALEAAPFLPGFDIVEPEILPETAQGRLERWQRKLLDLSVRNRLLNVVHSATAIPLLCPDPARLEDQLSNGRAFRFVPIPAFDGGAGRDVELHKARTGEELARAYAVEALERGEVMSPVEHSKLDAQLVELYRKARADMAEGGANTLFLAIGFLSWRKTPGDARAYRAPLILVPVKLDRSSVRAGIRLSLHEDEARFNSTLLQMLRQDFNLAIPELAAALPKNGAGTDVALIWDWVRRAVRDVPGFEVVEEVLLGTFSFAKFLMWKDLVDRTEAIRANPVVRHLLDTPREPFPRDMEPPRPDMLDEEISPGDLYTPLPADSSQLAAVVGSARGCNFVLDGPPGTGKSQTIANMIAHNLALGRRVLFVAEKRAALDVVHRRLKAHGLGPFCLELHSNKAVKQDVLRQLDSAWTAAEDSPAEEWDRQAAALKRERDALNAVVHALHRRHANGMTVHAAIGLVVRDGTDDSIRLTWPGGVEHDFDALFELRELARRLDLNRSILSVAASNGFGLVERTEWSNAWQADLVASAATLAHAAGACARARLSFLKTLSIDLQDDDAGLAALAELADGLPQAQGFDLAFAFGPSGRGVLDILRAALPLLRAYQAEASALPRVYAADAARVLPLDELNAKWGKAVASLWPLSGFKRRAVAQSMVATGDKEIDPAADLPRLMRMRTILGQLDALDLRSVPMWVGVQTDAVLIDRMISLSDKFRTLAARASGLPEELAAFHTGLKSLFVEAETLSDGTPVIRSALEYKKSYAEFQSALVVFRSLASTSEPDDGPCMLERLAREAEAIRGNAGGLSAWTAWRRASRQAMAAGLGPLVVAIEADAVPVGSTVRAFETAHARWWAAKAIDADPVLRDFNLAEHGDRIDRFQSLDDGLSKLTERYIRAKLCGGIPSKLSKQLPAGFATLQKQLQLQKPRKAVRELVAEMGGALTALAPCLLMSPLAIAQYLPADAPLFDLVIFDEASQIAPWDAVGAIARGRQVVVAGDPKQMPPTSFFDRASSVASEDDEDEDQESILDECIAAALPQRQLTWHYRSLHESLIAFSNTKYYRGNLITFPAPVTRESAVSHVQVPGVWGRSKTRTNQPEAEAIVAEVLRRLADPSFVDDKGRPLSLGVITLNSEQQRLIEDLLDKARQSRPELEPWFNEDAAEPVIVKNLETVQGDERDVILLGIGYGPDVPGADRMPMNFGPLNKKGGWRRLNVAATRARREMVVFTSFASSMIDLNRTSSEAVRDLKHFLEFADRGPRALGEAIAGSLGGYESPFEEAVAEGLRDRGWIVVPQIGVSRYRIDLGVVNPDRPGDYLCGVECDGATYHSAATARDRDKVRANVLRTLGWSLVRIWSTDWWLDRKAALDRLDASLNTTLELRRALDAATTKPTADTPAQIASAMPVGVSEPSSQPIAGDATYHVTSFEDDAAEMDSARFLENDYAPNLQALIRKVVFQEGPVRDDVLVERIARAHGFKRSGRLIRDRVIELTRLHFPILAEPHGTSFVWKDLVTRDTWNLARSPATPDDVRGLEDIAIEELRIAMTQATSDDPYMEVARRFGIRRLTQSARMRLEQTNELSLNEAT